MMKVRYIFWLAAAVVGYSYLGYPVWLWLRSRWSPRPVRRSSTIVPSVSAVMVVRNEEAVMARKLENLLTLDYPPEKLEIVVVSDGSSDRTPAILADYAHNSGAPGEGRPSLKTSGVENRLRILMKPVSQGKAAGLNDAIQLASGEVLLFTDARQQIERGALRLLMENFADPEVGAASGELMLGDPASGETAKGMGLYWRIEKKIRELESASGSVAGATGALYCARRAPLASSSSSWSSSLPSSPSSSSTSSSLPLPAGTILDDVLLPMQIVRQGFRVVFDSRARAWDSPDLGEGREFSRKVRTLSGNYQLLQIAPWLLSSENPIRFEFVSHKLSRLAVPFALLVLLIASALLPLPIYRAALGAQLAFYALSLAALAGVKIGPLARIADPARTFVVLNFAAMVAFINFVTGRKAVWVR